MTYRKAGVFVLIIGALLMCSTVSAQRGGKGDGSGGGRGGGRGEGRSSMKEQKKVYAGVKSVEVYSANGVQIYPSGKKSKGSGSVEEQIDHVEITEEYVRIIFISAKEDKRVIEFKCPDCIVLVDHRKVKNAARD